MLTFLALALFLQQPVPADTTDTPTETDTVEALDEASDVAAVLQPEPGYTEDEERGPGIRFRPRIAPSALYSSNRGFGIGGGVGITNLGWTGTDMTVDLRLQQRYQGANVTFFTDDPYESTVHGLVSLGGSTTERRRYFGLGPNTVPESEINLFHDAAQAEARLGMYPLGNTALYVQPGVRLLYDYSGGVNPDAGAGTLAGLDAKSREAVDVAAGQDRYGASFGIELATDLRDWPSYPRRGTFATFEHRRFFALDDSELTLARYAASAIGYLPIRGRTTVIVRGVGIFTRSGDADGDGVDDPIPFYYLPTLDSRVATAFRQDRLAGRDVLAVGAGIRAPIIDVLGIYGLDMLVMGYLGNAYDNVFEQFTTRISFQEGSFLDETGAALRPSLALGMGIVNLDKERVVVGGLVGLGPGGVTVATLRIAYDLRDARPLFR
ncbi:hypothetical protein [Rubrivirga sp. IMCC43871]|uniref:hypothetical protein n=1 Tax=Rubrivirga sp. IMCC43871 TaxID=3391575 RepID=UPI00398FF330